MSTPPPIRNRPNQEVDAKKQRLAELKLEKERLEAQLESAEGQTLPPPAPKPKKPKPPVAKQTKPSTAATAPPPKRSASKPLPAAAKSKAKAPPPRKPAPSPKPNLTADDPAPYEERGKWSIGAMIKDAPAWLVSMVIHMALLLCLAMFTFVMAPDLDDMVVVANSFDGEEDVETLSEFELEDIEPIEIETQQFSLDASIDPGAIAIGDLTSAAEPTVDSVGESALLDTPVGDIGALLSEGGDAFASVGDGLKAAASFFGKKSKGRKFVFIVDNSNSMGGGRFETALNELVKSVEGMSEQQEFYVIFFSDAAYRLFHPAPANGLVAASKKNKERLKTWLKTVEMCLRTNGLEAVQTALSMNPDVVYILGDGAFGDKTGPFLTAPHNRRTVVHTLGMEVAQRGEKELSEIAKANKGTYTLVETSPDAKAFAKANPIPKNRTRGSVWGIKLPNK